VRHEFHVACSPDNVIYINGPCRLQNELIASCLERETGVKCVVREDNAHFLSQDDTKSRANCRLALWDCREKDARELLLDLRAWRRQKSSADAVVLFNVPAGLRIEERFVWQGVHGFFYDHDSLGHFLKGVRVLLNGQLWLSRQIMTRCIIENKSQDSPLKKEDPILTAREIEILAQVAVGRTNQELADRLCISAHTVKTHLYNIYKKISVSNRLQAALWAAKHL
jgi:DNA-binding NarL/FixJ family response regulator